MTQATILVVDDELIIALGIEKRLKMLGYEVVGLASSGEEAIEMVTNLKPNLVFMDINLGPGIDGIEAATRIRERFGTPVVFLTAFSDTETLARAKLTGPLGYVLKPYTDKDLQTAIEIGLYRHELERKLRENEEWLAATLGSIGDGVIATDAQGQVRFVNALAERLIGRSLADVRGRDIREVFQIIGERTREPVENPVFGALERGVVVTLAPNTILIDAAGNEHPIDDTAAPIRNATGEVTGAVLVFRDVTERKRLEEHLRQAQKLEAIGRLAGGIAHDFNNIMTVIVGFSEILLADKTTSMPHRETAQLINDAGKRAAALTQQIMAFSRKQILVPCVLNLNTVVRDMGAMVRRLIGEHIEFVTELAPKLGSVEVDPTQLGQVILNLAANARDAMPHGGRLVITTADVERDEGSLVDPDAKPGRYVRLSVRDTGVGMPPEVLARVFEPFFTTKGVGQGTGLGLATVHGIVKQSGGHVEITSTVGAGTEFRVYLPQVETAPTGSGDQDPLPAPTGHEAILLVEDEDTVRKLIATILARNGYTVLEASHGLDAVKIAEEYDGAIHLLLTDLVMPHLSGREVADRITSCRPGTRVLFMSGYTDDTITLQGVEASTIDLLSKPFSVSSLTTAVRRILDRE